MNIDYGNEFVGGRRFCNLELALTDHRQGARLGAASRQTHVRQVLRSVGLHGDWYEFLAKHVYH